MVWNGQGKKIRNTKRNGYAKWCQHQTIIPFDHDHLYMQHKLGPIYMEWSHTAYAMLLVSIFLSLSSAILEFWRRKQQIALEHKMSKSFIAQ